MQKKILIMRHAEACSASENPERPLTPIGNHHAKKMAAWMKTIGVNIKTILHSSVLRSQQTAAIVGEKFGVIPTLLTALNPDESIVSLAGIIGDLDGDTLLVGHLPNIEHLSNLLITYDEQCATVSFLPGAVFAYALSETRCIIEWAINPELICEEPILF